MTCVGWCVSAGVCAGVRVSANAVLSASVCVCVCVCDGVEVCVVLQNRYLMCMDYRDASLDRC